MGIKEDGLSVLMRATSYSFYPIFAICFALMIAGTGRDFGPMRVAELAARERCRKRLRDASSAPASLATAAGSSVSRTCADQRPLHSLSPTHAQPHANPAPHANALTSSQFHPDPRTQQLTPISSSSPTPSSTDPLAQDRQWEVDSCHNHSAQSGLAQEDSGRVARAGEGGGSGKQHSLVPPFRVYSKDLAACELGEGEAGEGEGRAVGRDERNSELAMEEEGGGMAEGGEMAAVLDPHMQHDPAKPMRCINAAVPVGVMVVSMVGGIIASGVSQYYDEHPAGLSVPAPSLVEILSHAQTTKVLIWASLTANLAAVVLALGQGLLTIEQCMEAWIAGMRSVTVGLLTLLFAWGVGNMSQVLHVGPFVAGAVGTALPGWLLPTVVTIIAALVSVASGSSWGAMVLLFPTVLPLALVSDDSDARERASKVLVATIGGVISGSMFGDHVSPISDTTVLTSICTACPIVSLVECQASYCVLVLLVSVLASLFTAGVSESVCLLAYPIGVAGLYGALLLLSKPTSDLRRGGWDGCSESEGQLAGSEDGGAVRRGKEGRGARGRGKYLKGRGGYSRGESAGERDGLVHFPDGVGQEDSMGIGADAPAHAPSQGLRALQPRLVLDENGSAETRAAPGESPPASSVAGERGAEGHGVTRPRAQEPSGFEMALFPKAPTQ